MELTDDDRAAIAEVFEKWGPPDKYATMNDDLYLAGKRAGMLLAAKIVSERSCVSGEEYADAIRAAAE